MLTPKAERMWREMCEAYDNYMILLHQNQLTPADIKQWNEQWKRKEKELYIEMNGISI